MPALRRSYTYNSLPQGDVFRYLILQPGAGDDPIVCNLRTSAISEEEYDAVSYVWGTNVRDQHIECDGQDVLITTNLLQLLRRIRSSDKPLVLWADSICINQDDKNDKGHQVGLMSKIYRAAKRVLIHVGPDLDDHGPALCSLLEDVDQLIQETCKNIDMSWDSFPYPKENEPFQDDSRWDSLFIFLGQAWFDRGWVVQEAALARQGEVIWGRSRFSWEKLMRVYVWLSTRARSTFYKKDFAEVRISAHTDAYLETHKEFAGAFYDEYSWGTPSILRTLNCAKDLDLADPRDRIYAFMDLPQVADERVTIRPDYSAPVLDTYHRFAIEYIRTLRTVEILGYVCHNTVSFTSGIPSWVPRWDISAWSLQLASSDPNGMQSRNLSTFEPVITEDGHLKVRGVILDTVQYMSDIFDWETTTAETFKGIWDIVAAAQIESPYGFPSYVLDAFLDALSAGSFDGDISHWRKSRKRFAVELGIWPEYISDNDTDFDMESTAAGADGGRNIYYDYIRVRTSRRHFVLTQRGYMGLAPLPTREGDSCAIIFGCTLPCILRESDDDQSYTFAGAMTLVGKDSYNMEGGGLGFLDILGSDDSREWVDWDVEEKDILLC
ncbi:hypothetical protein HBI38_051170 [Parastagonospora nodorum]|nr:hypothetical protein HBI73_027690 [Parastagonospora nodorum]KAH5288501.1 hypothetical protein HBI11_243800 [Parastagonospora nodorum]KAH5479158.1 hypothetical protein HBI28_050250 [Parastagonospora nodorum]KAH5642694.1 hypothetical protein HBI22_044800 [Parastagonospora nodorum]KAH5994978.1 hypothetical protein HBI84_141010 [Parastagonospora nodorum]